MNAFIRSVQEIPDIVSMSLQNTEGFTGWHRPVKDALEKEDVLFSKIIAHRNFIVHRSMLVPNSKASMATIRGMTVKMALPFYVDPFDDSDVVVERFCKSVPENPLLLGILAPDEIQQLAVIREWHLDGVKGELIHSFRNAWQTVGKYLSEVLVFLGGEPLPENLPVCFLDTRRFQYKKYPNVSLTDLYNSAKQGCGSVAKNAQPGSQEGLRE